MPSLPIREVECGTWDKTIDGKFGGTTVLGRDNFDRYYAAIDVGETGKKSEQTPWRGPYFSKDRAQSEGKTMLLDRLYGYEREHAPARTEEWRHER